MAHTAVPDRIRWALKVVDPGPTERLLEIGCGPGVAAALVCDRLRTGRLVAIDRSPVAVGRTVKRNSRHLESGRLEVREISLHELAVPPASFDKAFAVDINLFWTRDPASELDVLSRALRPGGTLYVLFGAGPTSADRLTAPITAALSAHGFTGVETISGDGGVGVVGRAPEAEPS